MWWRSPRRRSASSGTASRACRRASQTLPPSLERDNIADKLRLIKGVLYWQLDAAFKTRSYQEQHALREVDHALEELQNRWVRVQRARAERCRPTMAISRRGSPRWVRASMICTRSWWPRSASRATIWMT